jgi:Protein of unknown function (DUF2628)
MSVYTVHEPPLRAHEASSDPERFVFVRDGFHFWAFLLAPLWMLWHRLWLVFVIYIIVIAAIQSAMHYAGVGPAGTAFAMLLVAFLVGVEASTLRRFTLARRGWWQVGIVGGSNAEAAERRFFDTWANAVPDEPNEPPASASEPPPLPTMPPSPDIVGLFPEPGAFR